MQKIRKAVIPAAGLGTRVLPATKAMPKEMLPIVDKPAIQYIVEEAAAAGIEEILIITSRGKGVMEDHFDRSPVLEQKLLDGGKKALYDQVVSIAEIANITYLRQKEQKGLGHAILQAKNFVGDEPFAVLYGDDVIVSQDPVCGQLIRAYETYGKACVGIKEVPAADISKYSSLAVKPLEGNLYACLLYTSRLLPLLVGGVDAGLPGGGHVAGFPRHRKPHLPDPLGGRVDEGQLLPRRLPEKPDRQAPGQPPDDLYQRRIQHLSLIHISIFRVCKEKCLQTFSHRYPAYNSRISLYILS